MVKPTNDRVPFLDVLVKKVPSGDCETSVYRKEINADVVLHFDSIHSACHIRSCAKVLFGRVDAHCSSDEARRQEKRTCTGSSTIMSSMSPKQGSRYE